MSDSTKICTREEKSEQDKQNEAFVQAKKAQFAAEIRDSGNQHKMPLVVTVDGQSIYTRENY